MATKSKIQNKEFNPVYKLALENIFPGKDVNPILEVCYNTPNADIAVQMLLDIYELPNLEEKVINKKGVVLTLESINNFEKRVNYSYQKQKTESFYFPKDLDMSTVNHENYRDFIVSWSPKADLVNETITFPEIITATSYCSMNEWQSFEKYVEPIVEAE